MQLVVIPTGGLAGFLLEQQRDDPRELIVGACLLMMGVPVARGLDRVIGRRSTDAAEPTLPSLPTGPDSLR